MRRNFRQDFNQTCLQDCYQAFSTVVVRIVTRALRIGRDISARVDGIAMRSLGRILVRVLVRSVGRIVVRIVPLARSAVAIYPDRGSGGGRQ